MDDDDSSSSDSSLEAVLGEGVRDIADAEDAEDDEPLAPPTPRVVAAEKKTAPRRRPLQPKAPKTEESVVMFAEWLEGPQEFSDDLKFVNEDVVDFGGALPLRIRQDRQLGKGGVVWDGAFALAEALPRLTPPRRVLELGAGATAVAGLAAAKFFPEACVFLTDGDAALLPLARRNVDANGLTARCHVRRLLWHRDDDGEQEEYWRPADTNDSELENEDDWLAAFDCVLAAECVAPIYDPQALVDTLRRVSTERTEILLVVKHARFPEHTQHFFDLLRRSGFDVELSQPAASRLKARANFRLIHARRRDVVGIVDV